MFIAQLAIALGISVVVIAFFLRYILTRYITRDTAHLEELSKDYTKKQEEAKRRLEEAKKESDRMLADARVEAEQYKNRLSKEAQQEKDTIIQEAHQKSENMLRQAEKTCELLKQDIDDKITLRAREKTAELMQKILPEKFQKEFHSLWLKESLKSDFQLDRLHLPNDIREVEVVSVSPLTQEQKEELKNKLNKRLGNDFKLKEKIDPKLIAGIVITLGSVVIDASLKYRIQQGIK